jgi:CHAT domain-containing protein
MSNFYQEWAQNRSASAALQKAQIQALKNPAQHPNDWAGFIVLD